MSEALECHWEDNALNHSRNDFIRVRADQTIAEALETTRSNPTSGRIVYFYVVDEEDRLKGVVPTRRLLLNAPHTRIADIMVRDVVALPVTATVYDACQMFIKYKLLALPVVDQDRQLHGVIDVDVYTREVGALKARESNDEIFQLIGVRMEDVKNGGVWPLFRERFPWLLCNIAGGLVCALLSGRFEHILQHVTALALYIPVVLTLAESVSIQSLTLTLQAQQGEEMTWERTFALLGRESIIGVLLGLGSGLLVAIAAYLWQRNPMFGVCIAASITAAVALAALFGFLVPTVLKALAGDPRVAAGPLALAMTDIATLLAYFSLAMWLLA